MMHLKNGFIACIYFFHTLQYSYFIKRRDTVEKFRLKILSNRRNPIRPFSGQNRCEISLLTQLATNQTTSFTTGLLSLMRASSPCLARVVTMGENSATVFFARGESQQSLLLSQSKKKANLILLQIRFSRAGQRSEKWTKQSRKWGKSLQLLDYLRCQAKIDDILASIFLHVARARLLSVRKSLVASSLFSHENCAFTIWQSRFCCWTSSLNLIPSPPLNLFMTWEIVSCDIFPKQSLVVQQ